MPRAVRRWIPVRARRACLLLMLVGAALPANAHAADGEHLKVTVDQPSRLQEPGSDQYLVGSRQPTFHIRADQVPAGYEVRCQVDNPPDGPCGTQDPQCPVAQCWTFSPSFSSDSFSSDGQGHQLSVSIVDSSTFDAFDVAGLSFDIDTTPPDTKLVDLDGSFPINFPFSTR